MEQQQQQQPQTVVVFRKAWMFSDQTECSSPAHSKRAAKGGFYGFTVKKVLIFFWFLFGLFYGRFSRASQRFQIGSFLSTVFGHNWLFDESQGNKIVGK